MIEPASNSASLSANMTTNIATSLGALSPIHLKGPSSS